MQSLEPAFDRAGPQHLPGLHRLGDALELDRSEVATVEQISDEFARAGGDHHTVGIGHRLQSCRQVQGFADGMTLAHLGEGEQVAHDHETAGDADAGLHRHACVHLDAAHGADELEARADRLLGGILARFRVAEVDERAVAHVAGHEATERLHRLGDAAVIGRHDLAHVLGIEARGQGGRPDQVAEQRGELAAFRVVDQRARWRPGGGRRRVRRRRPQRGDGLHQLLAVTKQDPELLEILFGELGQHLGVNGVVAKGLLVDRQIEAA